MQFIVDFFPILLLLSFPIAHAVTYNLVDDFSGQKFYENWDFYGSWDNLTLGDVTWVDRKTASSKQLAYVNSAGNAVIKVSTDTVTLNNKRDAVRITTRKAYPIGTIWIIDVVHLPFGCSVWPAIWTKGQNWPQGGEIDIVEGINLNTNNQMALHTHHGCILDSRTIQTGTFLETNCSTASGCAVMDGDLASYGDAFNKAGGGIWLTHFTDSGIYIWFWSRSKIPSSVASLNGSKPLVLPQGDWGTPTANYTGGLNCPITKTFSPQNMVIDITLCGVWAKNPQFYQPQCGGLKVDTACYTDNVVGNGTNYQYAYFEIKYVRAYRSAAAETVARGPVVFAVTAIVLGSITASLL